MSKYPVFKVGLTGGIASGKSSVTAVFIRLGIPVVDADIIAREVVSPGSVALAKLQQLVDQPILTGPGELDRAKLRQIIFADPAKRKQVEAILHPAIRQRSAELVQHHADYGAHYVVCVVPLLVETGQVDAYHRIALVDVPEQTQIKRLMARDNSNREQAKKILQSQATRTQRLVVADDVINNTTTLENLELRVTELHNHYLHLAAAAQQ